MIKHKAITKRQVQAQRENTLLRRLKGMIALNKNLILCLKEQGIIADFQQENKHYSQLISELKLIQYQRIQQETFKKGD